ncbi:MAG: hypothetical protein Q8K81_03075 [Sulfuricurvum sp.]|nr:hypothetical protein [Sulfuricurvum sp.]
MTPTRNSKAPIISNSPLSNTRILKSSYSKANKSEELIYHYSGQSSKPRSLGSLYKTRQTPPKVDKKESIHAFTARFEKKIFCHLSATEIEAIMNDNRRKIEMQFKG